MLVLAIPLLITVGPAHAQTLPDDDAHWSELFHAPGMNGEVLCFTSFRGDLVAGGRFTEAGGTDAAHVARWNGEAWESLGAGLDGDVLALAEYDDTLIAAGLFRFSGRQLVRGIARWDGEAWTPLGSGLNGDGRALAVLDGALITGGTFVAAGPNAVRNVGLWDGTRWLPIGTGDVPGPAAADIRSLFAADGELLAAGAIRDATGGTAGAVFRWDGATWQQLGPEFDGPVESVCSFAGKIYAGGSYQHAGDASAAALAVWENDRWRGLDVGVRGALPSTFALTEFEGALIAAGSFIDPSQSRPNRIVRWDGRSWSVVGSGLGGGVSIRALTVHDDVLFVGGSFADAGDIVVNHVAQLDARSWKPLASGLGMNGAVRAMILHRGEPVVAGDFTRAGATHARGIARWDGATWRAFGDGLDGAVRALALFRGELVAAGLFTDPRDRFTHIARWDGTAWQPLGAGVDAQVRDLAVFRGELVAVGAFTRAGEASAAGIAAWDGGRWRALTVDLDRLPYIATVTEFRDRLVIGGRFQHLDDVEAANIAVWDGGTWSAFADGFDGDVDDLLVHGGALYAAGFFGHSGATITRQIARWTGARWVGLGDGLIYNAPITLDPVVRLGSFGTDLILAGRFDGVDNIAARNLARWDGTAWHALGSGTDRTTLAVLDTGMGVLIGGHFAHAGDRVATFIARWNASPGIEVQRFSAGLVPGGVQLDWALSQSGLDRIQLVRVERSMSPSAGYAAVTGAASAPSLSMAHVDGGVEREGVYWYRLVLEHDGSAATIAGPYRVEVHGVFATALHLPGLSAGTTAILVRYSIATSGAHVRLSVYDVRGQLVRTLVDSPATAGRYTIDWARDTHDGRRAPSGVYFFRLDDGGQVSNAKLVLVAR
jgi:hypothetical protein